MNIFKRFPHFRQNNVIDCGPTCLRMIARFYGMDYSAEMLRLIVMYAEWYAGGRGRYASIGYNEQSFNNRFKKNVRIYLPG